MDIDIDIDKDNLKNIDIDMAILENIDIDIDIDMGILQNLDIDKISYRLEFGISNTPTARTSAATSCDPSSSSNSQQAPATTPLENSTFQSAAGRWTCQSQCCPPPPQ